MKKNKGNTVNPVKEDKVNRASMENIEEAKRSPFDYQDEFLDESGQGKKTNADKKSIQESPPIPGEHYKGNGNP